LQRPDYRPDIDGLRAVAVLSVVAFHASPTWIKGGLVGVDVFFVISGFLITSLIVGGLERGEFSFAEFYARRIRRIFPALVVLLLAAYAAGWCLLLTHEYKQLGKHMAGAAAFVANFVLWGESGYFDHAAETKPLLHLWSLGIEEQFYLAWPLLLWLGWKLRAHLALLTLLIAAASFAFNIVTAASDGVADFYSPLTRFWELLAGALLARQRAPWPGASLAGAVLIVLALLLIDPKRQFPGWWALLPALGSALIIAGGKDAWLNRTVLSSRPMVWIGLISYPLYLWHWPLLSLARILEGDALPRSVRLGAVLLAIVLAALTYLLVERPMRFGRLKRWAVPVLIAAMIGCGLLGWHAWRSNGVPGRFAGWQADMQALLTYDYFGGKTEAEFWGAGSCFLVGEPAATFDRNHCENLTQFPGRPRIFLIGDSHGAYLSRSLAPALVARRFNVSTFFAAECAPLALADPRPRCAAIARFIHDRIKSGRPDLVILFNDHMQHAQANVHGAPSYEAHLAGRVQQLLGEGAARVLVIGQIPTWKDSLAKSLGRRFILHGRPLPLRTYEGVVPESLDWDDRLKKIVPDYLSLRDFLCNREGCLTAAGADIVDSLLVFDYGHLTKAGADRIVQDLIMPAVEPIVGR
jgi:peptidoglycan/LPS O-acetylase OafA/YrhL